MNDECAARVSTATAENSTTVAARKPKVPSEDALDALYSLETIFSCNSTGIAHPAEAVIQKQDGLRNSSVRLNKCTEAALGACITCMLSHQEQL